MLEFIRHNILISICDEIIAVINVRKFLIFQERSIFHTERLEDPNKTAEM